MIAKNLVEEIIFQLKSAQKTQWSRGSVREWADFGNRLADATAISCNSLELVKDEIGNMQNRIFFLERTIFEKDATIAALAKLATENKK